MKKRLISNLAKRRDIQNKLAILKDLQAAAKYINTKNGQIRC